MDPCWVTRVLRSFLPQMHPASGLWEDLRLGQASLTFEPTGHRPQRRRVPHSAPKCGGDRQATGFSDPGCSPQVTGWEVQSLSSIWSVITHSSTHCSLGSSKPGLAMEQVPTPF